MTILTAPIYAVPHLLNYDLLKVKDSLPKLFVSSNIEGLPVSFGLGGIDDILFFKAKFGNATFRIPAYVIHFEYFEIKNILESQFSAIKTLQLQVEKQNVDFNAVVDSFIKFIDKAMLSEEARKLTRHSLGSIQTTTAVDLLLRHGTCLVEGKINFPNAKEDGNHQFKISYFDLSQEEFEDEDPNFTFDKSEVKGIYFTFTDIRGWKPSQESQSAEWAYGFRLPNDLSANTKLNDLQGLMREMIDYLSVQWNEEFGEDLCNQGFTKIIFDSVLPYIRHIDAIKAIYQK